MNLEHHAICIEGDCERGLEELQKDLEKVWKFNTKANPDYFGGVFESFGIDDAHAVAEFQIKKPLVNERKVIVLTAQSLTTEAQNALLKIFEEPAPNTHFFLLVNSVELLLPTLRSRMQVTRFDLVHSVENVGQKFVKAGKAERLEMIKEIAEEKNKVLAQELFNQIEREVVGNKETRNLETEEIELLKTVNQFRGYLNDRAPALKMILEHVALTTPKL